MSKLPSGFKIFNISRKASKVSTPATAKLISKTGTVARLVDRLLQQNPTAPVKFCVTGVNQDTPAWKKECELLSVYSDDKGTVWVDIG